MADLILQPGESRSIYSRTYKYDNVIIPSGAKLEVVPNSRNWLVLLIPGNCDVSGSIAYEKMWNNGNEIQYTSPDGRVLTHLPQLGKGGRGGNGGDFRNLRGGTGANGDSLYGGGGGQGASRTKYGGESNGISGDEWRGGGNANARYRSGGRGAKIGGSNIHGGAIYLSVGGALSNNSEAGTISLRGSDGASGIAGKTGVSSVDFAFHTCGGGGGGGAPGGVGGQLIVKCSNILLEPLIELSGGTGGSGGAAGPKGGSPGEEGDPGINGFVDFI